MVLFALYCSVAAVRALIGGVDTWWLWLAAAASHLAALLVRRIAGLKLGAVRVRPDVQTGRRHRRALWFTLPATACLYAAQPLAASAARLNNGYLGAVSVVLFFAALAGFAAAGWAAVWVYRDRATE